MKSALPLNQNELETSASDDASIEEVCENFCESDDSTNPDKEETDEDEEISAEDKALLKSFGFTKALLRLETGEDDSEDDEESERTTRLPSERGFGAVAAEFRRMNTSWDD
jgi:hypothetical protein